VAVRDLCALADVTRLVPGYTAGDDTNTDATLNELITEQSRDAMERCGREFTPIEASQPALRSFDIDETVARRRKLFRRPEQDESRRDGGGEDQGKTHQNVVSVVTDTR